MFRANHNHNQQTLFDSTQWMNPKILEKLEKSWAPIFYEHVFCKIDEEPFAVLYGTTGKPNFPVNILLSLEYIKHMKCCSDLELLDYFYFDYLVNYAVGIRTLGEMNLAERTLYYFRERVYQYCLENPGKDDLLFGQFIKLLRDFAKEAGISLEEQRTDTTLFMSNIKKAGRVSLAYDVLVKAVKAIPKEKLTGSLSNVLEPDFKTDVLYRAKAQEGDSKLTLLLNLCQEALLILEAQPDMLDSEEVRIVRRFLSEQSTTEAESGKLIPKPKKEIPSGSLQAAHDEDATFRRKGNVSQSGYVLEISETCDKGNTFQLITDYAVESNNTSDVEILQDRLKGIHENTGCTDMYVDGGFHSEHVHQTAKENGIEIHLTNMSGTEPTKKLPVTEFDIDETTNIINKCPGGYIPTHAGVSGGQTSAHFPHEACANCEYRKQCYSKKQVKDCVIRIPLKAVKTGRERETMKASRKENTSKRAGIEGSNSALKRSGLDKLDVRGKAKSTVVCGLKVTVQNIKRFIKYLQGGYKPKTTNIPLPGISAPIFS
ncbi:MAG: hypothetical protein HPY66_3560 [Firmicutes bacterium]|nr:hypothetical protein [Bacillota bacterium]